MTRLQLHKKQDNELLRSDKEQSPVWWAAPDPWNCTGMQTATEQRPGLTVNEAALKLPASPSQLYSTFWQMCGHLSSGTGRSAFVLQGTSPVKQILPSPACFSMSTDMQLATRLLLVAWSSTMRNLCQSWSLLSRSTLPAFYSKAPQWQTGWWKSSTAASNFWEFCI